jgi:NAD(P)-dependent dehydrogenase (short-subunit alcohol dehydrogenase family)
MHADSRQQEELVSDRWTAPHTTVVTGANGWLGRALVHRLLADPARRQLRLLAHSTADAAALATFVDGRDGVEIIIGDISRADTSRRLLFQVGADADVLHTAGIIHPKSVRQFTEVNTNGTRHITEAALDAEPAQDQPRQGELVQVDRDRHGEARHRQPLAHVAAVLEGHAVGAGELQVRQALARLGGHRQRTRKARPELGRQPVDRRAAALHHVGRRVVRAEERVFVEVVAGQQPRHPLGQPRMAAKRAVLGLRELEPALEQHEHGAGGHKRSKREQDDGLHAWDSVAKPDLYDIRLTAR